MGAWTAVRVRSARRRAPRARACRRSTRSAAETELDVLVVGGGVVGAGVALDAVTRGLSTGLLEQRDLASGTSSRSSKLIHGGLRYLEMLDFGLVREALRGARPPAHPAGAAPGPAGAVPLPADPPRLGASVRRRRAAALRRAWRGSATAERGLPRHRHLTRRPCARIAPDFAPEVDRRRDPLLRLPGRRRPAGADGRPHRGGPRRAASRPGSQVTGFLREGERVVGVRALDLEDGDASSRSAPASSSTRPASGPTRSRRWSAGAGARTCRRPRASTSSCRATGSAPRPGSSSAPRRRVLFVIPWGRHWIIGTTDTPWDLDKAHPAASRSRHRLRARPRQRDPARAARPRGRRGRVRRAAAAALRRVRADLADLPRAHGRHAGAGPRDDRRRQAHDVPGDGPRRRRRRRALARPRRTDGPRLDHRPGAAASAPTGSRRAPTSASSWPAAPGCTSPGSTTCSGGTATWSTTCSPWSTTRPELARAARRRRGLPRRRGRLRRHPRGRAAPRRRAHPPDPDLDRDLRPRRRCRADGRGR